MSIFGWALLLLSTLEKAKISKKIFIGSK